MRIKNRVQVRISRDADMKRLQFSDDEVLSEVIIDEYERQTNGDLNIAASGTESLSFGDVDVVKGMYLDVDKDAEVKLNGSLDAITLRKPPVAGTVAKFFIEADITAVEITNLDGTDPLTGVFVFWGDPTP